MMGRPWSAAARHGGLVGLPAVVEELLDLLTIRDFARVTTARVPRQGRAVDIFAPEVVVWAYEGPLQQALLELVHPARPEAPTASYPAPASLHVPRAQQRPMTTHGGDRRRAPGGC